MSESTAADSEAEAAAFASRMYANDRATRSLGIRIEDVALGRATARMRVSADMVNGHAIAHGGYIFLLADTAFAFACNTHGATVASAAEIAFVRPAREGDDLIAEARERVRFGRSGVYDVTVRDIEGNTVAEFRGHSRQLRSRTG